MNPYLLLGVLCLGFGVMALFLRWQMEKVAGKGRGDDLVVEMLKGLLRSTDERLRGNQEAVNSLSQSLAKILQQNTQNTTSVLQKNTQDLNLRLDKTAENISRVAREVGQMSEIGRSMKELQEFLKRNENYAYLNLEQDLGVSGIRKSKLSYHPFRLVKKYTLS